MFQQMIAGTFKLILISEGYPVMVKVIAGAGNFLKERKGNSTRVISSLDFVSHSTNFYHFNFHSSFSAGCRLKIDT